MKIERKSFQDCKGNTFQVTVLTVGGKRLGPTITIVSGQHGMEHSGPCFLPELAEELDQMDFAGTVHICPCANPGALAMDYEFYPEAEDLSKIKDYYYSRFRHEYSPWGIGRGEAQTEYNMNRLWNKTGKGIAYDITGWLWKNYAEPADLVLDIHCAQHRKPFIFNDFEKNNPLIAVTGFEVVVQCPHDKDSYNAGNLNFQSARREGHYAFCMEFSIQHGLKESEYPLGKNAIKNLMIKMKMLDAKPVLGPHPTYSLPYPQTEENAVTLKTHHAGHIRFFFDECEPVRKGEVIFEVRDMQTLEVLERCTAPFDGILYGITHMPIAKPDMRASGFFKAEQLKAEF